MATAQPEIRRSARARRPPKPVYEVKDTRKGEEEEDQRASDVESDENQVEQGEEDQATSGEDESEEESEEESDEFAMADSQKPTRNRKAKVPTKKQPAARKPPLAPSSRSKVKAIAQAQAQAQAKAKGKAKAKVSALLMRKRKLRPVREESARKKAKKADGNEEEHEAADEGEEEEEEEDDDENEEDAQNVLFEAIKRGKCSLDNLLEEWRERFTENEEDGAREVLNFILQSCGGIGECVPSTEPLNKLDMGDLVEIVVEDLQQSGDNYPIASRQKGFKQFQSTFTAFWKHFVEECVDSEILFTKTLVDDLVDWLTSLSSAEVRAIRHTTSVAANAIGNGLVECASKLSGQASVNDRQLKAAEEAAANASKKTPPRGGRGKKSATSPTPTPPSSRRMNHLKKTKQSLETRLNKCLQLINNLFTGVIVHRYRDVMHEIRKETISTLGFWLKTFPGEFLKNNYLKYLGWMLNDKSPEVRGAVLDDLHALYENEELAKEMEHFTTRFIPRFIELCSDIDDEVVHKSIRLLIEIDRRGLINAEVDLQPIESLVFDKNSAAIRKAAAEFVCLQYSAFGISEAANQQHTPTGKKKAAAKKAALLNKEQLTTQAIALVEFAEDYLSNHISSQAVTAAVDTFVDAFWGLEDCQVLQDCQLMTRLLLADKNAPDLTSDQQTILIRILVASVEKLLNSSDSKAETKRQLAKQKQELGVFFCKELAHLLGLFQSDEAKVELLVKLISLLPLTREVVDQHLKNVKALLDRLMVVYLGSSQEKQLKMMSFAIHHLVQSENEALKREANMIIHELFERVLEQTANSLMEDADLFAKSLTDEAETKRTRKSPRKEKDSNQRELDVEFAVRACLCRLKCLIRYFNPRLYLSTAVSSGSQEKPEEDSLKNSTSQEKNQVDQMVVAVAELIERRTTNILGLSKCFWTPDTIGNAMMILHCDLLWLLEPVFAKAEENDKKQEVEEEEDDEEETEGNKVEAKDNKDDDAKQKKEQEKAANGKVVEELIERVKTARNRLEKALVLVLQMHLKHKKGDDESDDDHADNEEMELEELALDNEEVATFVRESQRMAFLVFCDTRCLFVEKFGRAAAPYDQLEWSLPTNLSNLSQIYFSTETEPQEPEEEEEGEEENSESSTSKSGSAHKQKQRAMLVAAFGRASLCNPNSKRQAAAVLQHIINSEKDVGDIAKAFSRILKAESPIRYLEIQMLSLRQLFNSILGAKVQLEDEQLDEDGQQEVEESIKEDESALKDLAKKLTMSLGVGRVPSSLRAPFFRFVCEGVRFAMEKPAHFLFLEAMRFFLKHLDLTSARQLLKYFGQLLDQIDGIPEDKEAIDAGWKLVFEFQSTLTSMTGKSKDDTNTMEGDKEDGRQEKDEEENGEEPAVDGDEQEQTNEVDKDPTADDSKTQRKRQREGESSIDEEREEKEEDDAKAKSPVKRKNPSKSARAEETTRKKRKTDKESEESQEEDRADSDELVGSTPEESEDKLSQAEDHEHPNDDEEETSVKVAEPSSTDDVETEELPPADEESEKNAESSMSKSSSPARGKRKRKELEDSKSDQQKKLSEQSENGGEEEENDEEREGDDEEIDSRRARRRRKMKE